MAEHLSAVQDRKIAAAIGNDFAAGNRPGVDRCVCLIQRRLCDGVEGEAITHVTVICCKEQLESVTGYNQGRSADRAGKPCHALAVSIDDINVVITGFRAGGSGEGECQCFSAFLRIGIDLVLVVGIVMCRFGIHIVRIHRYSCGNAGRPIGVIRIASQRPAGSDAVQIASFRVDGTILCRAPSKDTQRSIAYTKVIRTADLISGRSLYRIP